MRGIAGPFDLRGHQRQTDCGHPAPRILQTMVRKHQHDERDVCAPIWTLLRFETFLREVSALSAAAGSSATAA